MELLGKLSSINDILLIIKVLIFRDEEDLKKLLSEKPKKEKEKDDHTDNSTNNNINITIKK